MPELHTLSKQELLAGCELFSHLSNEQLETLVQGSRVKRVTKREVVFRKGDKGRQMFTIVRGRVRMSTVSPDGREIVFGILEAGETFGELGLLDGQTRTATVTALDDAEFMALDRQQFIPFLERNPCTAIRLLEILSARLRATDEILEDTVFLELSCRLAKKLLSLAEQHGVETEEGTLIDMTLTQQDLANLVGTSRESVNKQLRAWEAADIVRVSRQRVTIVAHDELEDRAWPC